MKRIDDMYEEMLKALTEHDFEKVNQVADETNALIRETELTEEEKKHLAQKAEKINEIIVEKMHDIKDLLLEQNKNNAVSKKYEDE